MTSTWLLNCSDISICKSQVIPLNSFNISFRCSWTGTVKIEDGNVICSCDKQILKRLPKIDYYSADILL